jgi:tyrosyl-tRNA synthetase
MADLTPQERFEKITKNLQEVLNPEIIEEIVVKQNKPLVVYWGNDT